MNYVKQTNPLQASIKDLGKSRYDYDSTTVSHDALTRGIENCFKESR